MLTSNLLKRRQNRHISADFTIETCSNGLFLLSLQQFWTIMQTKKDGDNNDCNNQKFTKTLEELEKCGFIRQYVPFDDTVRDILFQLTDAFTLFHFQYAAENKYQDESYWTNSLNSARYRAWSGIAFEMLCLNHIQQIKQALGISGIQSRACCWLSKKEGGEREAQIDLLIDRADQTINLCEMKFSRGEYEIDRSDDETLSRKIDTFMRQTKTRKSLMLTLVTSFGLKKNKYSGQVQRLVTLEDLFK
jgi:hypothetical protein